MPNIKRIFAVTDFSKGLNTLDDPWTLEDGESPDMLNVDVVKKGSLITRFGYELVSTLSGSGGLRGLLPYYRTYGSPTADYLLIFHNDGHAYSTTNADLSTTTDLGSIGTDNGKVRGIVFNNLAIFGNGLAANTVKKWDGTTLANLGSVPADANLFGVFQKHLFINDTATPSKIWYSDADTPETWTSSPFLNVDIGNGEDVTGVVGHNENMEIYKENSIYSFNFSFDGSFNLTVPSYVPVVSNAGGCTAPDSLIVDKAKTFFLSKRGFQAYGIHPRNDFRVPESLSDRIDNTVSLIDSSKLANVAATYFDKKYICAVPTGATEYNDLCLVHNTTYGGWTAYNDIPAVAFAKFRDTQKRDQLYFASGQEPKLFKFNTSFSDNGFGYIRRWGSKTYRMGTKGYYDRLVVEGSIASATNLTVVLTVDGVEFEDTINVDNLIQGSSGAIVGDSYVGSNLIGGSGGPTVSMYRFRKVIPFPAGLRSGYEMSYRFQNDGEGEGWKIDRVEGWGEFEPSEPGYPKEYN